MGERDRKWRVTLQWTYRAKKGGVSLGLTIVAPDEDEAIMIAISEHITPYEARVYHAASAEAAP